jgi:hypothetical protein
MFVVLVVVVTAVVAVAAAAQSRADRWNRGYQAVAHRFGGTCMNAGWFGRPSVRFRYGATHALLNTYKAGASHYTQVVINWPDPNLRLEVYAQPAPAGLPEHDPGSVREFFLRYFISGPDPDANLAFLSDGVRWQIERLRQVAGSDEVYVSVYRGRLLVRKRVLLRQYSDLEEFTQVALELYDQAMLTRSTGIEFVQEATARTIEDAVCRVCGDAIVTDMVFCRRCKTPHHLECWQYYGACAVYGCQETRWVAPRAAGPSASR